MLRLALHNLNYRKRRSLLTVLGVIIGTTLIMTLLFLGEGMERAIGQQLQAFGGDLIIVTPGKEGNFLAGVSGELRDRDVAALNGVLGADLVLPMQFDIMSVEFAGETKATNFYGGPWREVRRAYEESQGFGIAEGYWPEDDSAPEVIVGSLVATEHFREDVRVGDDLVVKGRRFTVAGILKPSGDPNDDSAVYASLDRFRLVTGNTSGVRQAIIKVSPGWPVAQVADDVRYRLEQQPGIGDFTVLTSEQLLETVGDVLGLVSLVLAGIAAVALLVGGVGIMNTMFTAVLERTREVGVLRAVGATRGNILNLFLLESGILGAIGGGIGTLISIGIAELVEFAARSQGFVLLSVEVPIMTVVAVLFFTFILGMIFGAIPAIQASRLRPSEALRYE